MLDRPLHAPAGIAVAAIAQFVGFVGSGGRARGDADLALTPADEGHRTGDGGGAAAVQDLPAVHGADVAVSHASITARHRSPKPAGVCCRTVIAALRTRSCSSFVKYSTGGAADHPGQQ